MATNIVRSQHHLTKRMTMASFLHSATADRRAQCFHYAGETIDWHTMLDINLRTTDDASKAVVVVYEWDQDEFTAIDLRLFRESGSNSNKHQVWLDSAISIEIKSSAINRSGNFFRLEDDAVIPFTAINVEGTTIAVFELPDGLYRGLDLRSLDDEPDYVETLQ